MSRTHHVEAISHPPAIAIINDQPRTLSVDVAEYFRKSHKDVIRQLRNLIENSPKIFTERNFTPSEYTDSTGRKLPAYSMTKDGFTLLAMGFTGPKALQFKLAYIEAFNRMAAMLRQKHAPVSWGALPADIDHLSPSTRLRCLKLALQSAAMSGHHSQTEQHDIFIGFCRMLGEPAPPPPSGPNGPELQAFVKACLEPRPGARLQARAIKERLQQWWAAHYPDRPLPTSHEVNRLLRKSFELKKGDGGAWVYKGVTFRSPVLSGNSLEGVNHENE